MRAQLSTESVENLWGMLWIRRAKARYRNGSHQIGERLHREGQHQFRSVRKLLFSAELTAFARTIYWKYTFCVMEAIHRT